MLKKEFLQISNLIGFIAVLIVNLLATLLPIGLGTPQELSDALPNLFVPAGITFSIWFIIYIFLGLFSIYQIRDIFKKEKIQMKYLDDIGYYFIIGSLANIIWIFLWHYGLVPLSLIFMIVLLVSLLLIYTRLNIGKSEAPKMEKIAVHILFSLYLGWISVATIANVTATLVFLGVSGFGLFAEILTVLIIVVVVLITSAMLILRKDYIYSLVIFWALLGIFIKQIASNSTIAITSIISGVIILVGILYVIFKEKR